MAKNVEYVYGSEFIDEDISEVNVLIKIMNEVAWLAIRDTHEMDDMVRGGCGKRCPFTQNFF